MKSFSDDFWEQDYCIIFRLVGQVTQPYKPTKRKPILTGVKWVFVEA